MPMPPTEPTPPSEDVVAAIVAAVQATWPVAGVTSEPAPPPTPLWRFSGRWWRKPVAARRDRPR
jgi:hypothetical protein